MRRAVVSVLAALVLVASGATAAALAGAAYEYDVHGLVGLQSQFAPVETPSDQRFSDVGHSAPGSLRGYDGRSNLARTFARLTTAALAPQGARGSTVGELRASGQADAHHIIQDAAVRDVPGYKTNAAPGIRLDGPSTTPGSPHYNATQVQRTAGVGGTYGAERQAGCMALAAAGCSPAEITDAISWADDYFMGELGLTLDSPLRIPGNRRIP